MPAPRLPVLSCALAGQRGLRHDVGQCAVLAQDGERVDERLGIWRAPHVAVEGRHGTRCGAVLVVGAGAVGKRYQLSTTLYARNDIDLTIAEAALLQERVAKLYESPLIVGRIGDMLEGREVEAADTPAAQA